MVATSSRRAPGRSAHVTGARRAAAAIMAAVREGQLLDLALDEHAAGLEPRDRRWLQELAYGALRRRGQLDAWLAPRVTGGLDRLDPDLVDLLRLGAYQLGFMDSVPAYAAIAQTVELVKERHHAGAAGLANAVLRRLDRERTTRDAAPANEDAIDRLAREGSHPRWLVARWLARWGEEQTAALLAANNVEAPLVIRPWGTDADALEAEWRAEGLATEPAPLLGDGWQCRGAPAVAALPGFGEGRFFVQDPAATLVTRYAAFPDGATVLDLCAAPGGKALELARHARRVIAADRSVRRLARVDENVRRLHVANVFLAVADAGVPPFAPVDAVLVDAPCTGTGTFRRHPDARWRLKPSDLAVTGAIQRDILDAAAGCVRPGGLLVYSTCSLEPEENEEQATAFSARNPEFAIEPPVAGAVPDDVRDGPWLRVLPQRHGTDGAFAARWRRTGAS